MQASIILERAADTSSGMSATTLSTGEGSVVTGSCEGCTIRDRGLPLEADGLVGPGAEVLLIGEGSGTPGRLGAS